MKKFTKAFFLGSAAFAIGFATLIPHAVEARQDRNYGQNYSGDDQNYYDDSQNYGNDQSGNNDDGGQNYGNDQGGNNNDGQEAPSGPSLNVSVEMNMSGEYGQMFDSAKDKYEVFMRALNNPKDSTKGSEPVRLSVNGGDATFKGIAQDPKGLLVALSKEGSNYQYFCSGKGVKDGVIQGFPEQITVILKNGNKPYKTAAGTLRNDSYPNCEVQF